MGNKKIFAILLGSVAIISFAPVSSVHLTPGLNTALAQTTQSCSGMGSLSNPSGRITDLSTLPPNVAPQRAAYYCTGTGFVGTQYIFFDSNDREIANIASPAPGTFVSTGLGGATGGRAKTLTLGPQDCNFEKSWAPFFKPGCWGRLLGALVASIFVSIGASLLELAGWFFNHVLQNTIVDFKGAIFGKIEGAINIGWTVFRDLANITIIGVFTFIALSIIFGLKSYGQKKLVANVLIVAVLINFSLLFTKIIIDASNFTATQFYRAAIADAAASKGSVSAATSISPTGSTSSESSPTHTTKGISGSFMETIGITGFADSYKYVRSIQEEKDSGIAGFLFGLMSFIFLLGAAIVLFYGSFLLITRAVLLIFLMLTSAAAFATYLIPNIEKASYGWKTWIESLAQVAVFAPLLLLFLWITLTIAKALKPITTMSTTTSTLGQAGSSPGGAVAAMFGYFLILGMLFLSFKLSSKLSGKIAGFSTAAMVPGAALGLGLRGVGALGTGLGWGASALRGKMLNNGWTDADVNKGVRGFLMRGATVAANKAATTNFNALQNKTFGKFTKALGIPKALSGGIDTKGGFDGLMTRRAQAGVAKGKALAPTASYLAAKGKAAAETAAQAVREEINGLKGERAALDGQKQTLSEIARAEIDHEKKIGISRAQAAAEAGLSGALTNSSALARVAMERAAANQPDSPEAREGIALAQSAQAATDKANMLAESAESQRKIAEEAHANAETLKADAAANPSDPEKAGAADGASKAMLEATNEAERLAKDASAARVQEEQAHQAALNKMVEATSKLEKTAAAPAPAAASGGSAAPGAASSGGSGSAAQGGDRATAEKINEVTEAVKEVGKEQRQQHEEGLRVSIPKALSEAAQQILDAQAELRHAQEEKQNVHLTAEARAKRMIETSPVIKDITDQISARDKKLVEIRIKNGVKGEDVYSGRGDDKMIRDIAEKVSKETIGRTQITVAKSFIRDPRARTKVEGMLRERQKTDRIKDLAAAFTETGAIETPPAPAPAPSPTPPTGGTV